MCVSAGARARELPGCSFRTLHHGHHHSLPSRPSVATASSFSVGRQLYTTEASLPLPSRPPPCLRLLTPTGDPPPRSPQRKKPSPVLSSVSMLCSGPATDPLISLEPSKSGTPSTRCELAAVALLSTVPLRPKGRSRSRMSPPKLSRASYRSSSPFPCNSATRVSNVNGSAAKSPPLSVTSASPSPRNLGKSDACSHDFILTRWSPQVASPVPRKSASSVLPPRLAAQNPVIPRKSGQRGDLLQPQNHALRGCPSQGIRQMHVPDDLEIAIDSSDIAEGGVMDGHCLRNGILDRNICPRCVPVVKAELSFSSSAKESWEAKVIPAFGICKERGVRSLWEGKNSGSLHRTVDGTLLKGSTATRAFREETHCPCVSPLLQKTAVPTYCARWPERGGENSYLPLRIVTGTTHETAHPTAMPCFHAKMGLFQSPCSSSHSYKRQRTYRAKCADCIPLMNVTLPAPTTSDPCFSALSEPHRFSSPPAEHTSLETWHATDTQCLGNKEADTEVQQTFTCVSRGVRKRPSSSPVQKFGHTGHFLFQTCVALPSLATRRSVGGAAAALSLSNSEEVGRAGTLTPTPQLSNLIGSDSHPFTGHSSALLHRQHVGAAPPPGEDSAPCLISAAEGLINGARHETCSRSPRPPSSCQAPSLTTLDAVDSPGNGQVIMLGLDRARAARGFPGVQADGDGFSLLCFSVGAGQEAQQSISTNVSTGARGDLAGVQKRRDSGLDYSGKSENDGECPLTMPGGGFGASFKELSQLNLGRKANAQGSAEEGAFEEVVIVEDSEEAYVFSELQHTLKELQKHTTALRPRDIIFGTEIPQELLSIELAAQETENNLSKREEALLSTQASGMEHDLQYCMLEEGSFGKVFVGRFLGKLPTNGARRWWRTLPLCERFLRQASYALPSPIAGFLPLHVQEAMENNVKVAIKVPVEAMMLRDPLGVLARTLNEWKILELVHEKRNILFSQSHGREDVDRTTHGIVHGRATQSGETACRKELGSYNYERAREDVSLVFCQEHFSHEHLSSRAFESWHPMHPQAEPPGVVELVGGVVHGPLDVWLVTRLATGKDLHTRKYSRSLADGVAIPPAAGLAMCRQLAAIVDFLHARTTQTLTPKCATVDATRSYRRRKLQVNPLELLTCGGSEAPNNTAGSYKGACDWDGECEPDRDLSCNVRQAPVIVHRDIKPENIIVDDHWRIQLCDFGDAEATPDGVVSRVSGATWLYAPVELLCAAPLNDSSDVGSECESCRYPGLGSRGHRPCTSANGARCRSRARSCPTLAHAQNPLMEGYACDNAQCAEACLSSSYRGVDAIFTEKWDIWSMGCVFQEMFGFPNPMSSYVAPTDPPHIIYEKLKRKAQNGQLVPVIAPEIQGIARQIIFACLRSDPEARPSATAVLRMWSAPEEEILKDIRLPASCPTLEHGALHAAGPTTAPRQRASPKKPPTCSPGIDRCRALTHCHKDHEQKDDEGRNLNKSATAFPCPERPYSCMGRVDSGTFTGWTVSGQEDVYIVPNIAVVQYQYDLSVKRTSLAT